MVIFKTEYTVRRNGVAGVWEIWKREVHTRFVFCRFQRRTQKRFVIGPWQFVAGGFDQFDEAWKRKEEFEHDRS